MTLSYLFRNAQKWPTNDRKAATATTTTRREEENYIMDNFFAAVSLFRRRKYDECIEVCNELLQNNALHQGPWELKMRSMTQRVYIDDIEADDDVAGKFLGCSVFGALWDAIGQNFI